MDLENMKLSQSPMTPRNESSENGKNSPVGGLGPTRCEEGPVASTGKAMVNIAEKKRGRGRPRKYDALLGTRSSQLLSSSECLPSFSIGSMKRRRGRPKGTGKLQVLASLGGYAMDTAGGSFTPHVVDVPMGEDIVNRITSISLSSPKAVCVLSATGSVSCVIIRQPGPSGGILRYDGRFEILSLSGSFVFPEFGSPNRKNGMLSVSLAKPDGRVFGGAVAGSLIAAAPIQLIIASFKQNIGRELRRKYFAEPSSAGSHFGGPELVNIPIRIREIADEDEQCTTPTSVHSAPLLVADNLVAENDNFNYASLPTLDPHVMQGSHVSQPMSDQMMPPSTDGSVPDM